MARNPAGARKPAGRRRQGRWIGPTGPPHITLTFELLEKKLREIREAGYSTEVQLAVADYWIGRLFELKARLQFGGRI